MTENQQEFDADRVIERIKNMSPEEKQIFQRCMSSEGVYNALWGALYGAMTGGLFALVPGFKTRAKYIALFTGTTGYLMGRSMSSLVCLKKAMGEKMFLGEEEPHAFVREKRSNDDRQGFDTSLPQYTEQSVSSSDFGEPIGSFDSYANISEIPSQLETDLTETVKPQPNLSYDELREKNRIEYQKKSQRYYEPKPSRPKPTPKVEQPEDVHDMFESNTTSKKRTKYGDVWE